MSLSASLSLHCSATSNPMKSVAAKSQGCSPFVLDTHGNGKRDDYVEPNAPLDPNKDKRIVPGSGPYAVMPSPVDGSIWYTVGIFGGTPGVLRFDPATELSEVYNVPAAAISTRTAWSGHRYRVASSGALIAERRPHALAQGRRQRLNATRRARPVSARSAGELKFAETI
jgi:hypothetical protein